MILSRVIKHLREQNWTAIGIDFLIVVVGVFLGAQASNWNEERKVRAGEREFLMRLHEDVSDDMEALAEKRRFMRSVGEAGKRSEAFIAAGRPCAPGTCWAVLRDFFAASQFQGIEPSRGALEALQRSPYPYDRALKRDVVSMYSLLQQSTQVAGPSEYRRRMRLYVPMKLLVSLWRCNRTAGETQIFDFNCGPGQVTDAEARAVVERLRSDPQLRAELAVDVGMRASMDDLFEDIGRQSRSILDRIETKTGSRP